MPGTPSGESRGRDSTFVAGWVFQAALLETDPFTPRAHRVREEENRSWMMLKPRATNVPISFTLRVMARKSLMCKQM